MWDPYAEFQSATLPNGLTVHAAHWPGRPWEAMGFLIHSGAEHDPIGLEGVAHFVEHLVSENTNISRKDISGFFEDCGGSVNLGSTSHAFTEYKFFAPADRRVLAKALVIFGDMLMNARLENLVERERQVITGEFNRRYPIKFQFDLEMRMHKSLYAGYWLERYARPMGAPESISAITQRSIQAYYDIHYTPPNISVVGVGDMNLRELVELLSQSSFSMDKKGSRTPLPVPPLEILPPSENRYIFETSKHITDTPRIGTYKSVSKIPGSINPQVLRITSNMLSEVLNEEVREKRAWAYSIGSSWRNLRHFYQFSIGCNALSLKAIDTIEEVVEACIVSLKDRGDLFERKKRQAVASLLAIDPTGRDIRDGTLEDLANHQRIISLAETASNLKRVTMEDVRSLLEWLRPEKRWTLIARP